MTRSTEEFALPPYAHLPGQNKRHQDDFMDLVKERTLEQTLNSNSANNPGWLHGLHLIDLGYFWEAHEILETVWMRAAPNSREKNLVQGVIHLANAFLKIKMNRPKAAARLMELASAHIDEAFVGGGGGGGNGDGGDGGDGEKILMLLPLRTLKSALTTDQSRPKLYPFNAL